MEFILDSRKEWTFKGNEYFRDIYTYGRYTVVVTKDGNGKQAIARPDCEAYGYLPMIVISDTSWDGFRTRFNMPGDSTDTLNIEEMETLMEDVQKGMNFAKLLKEKFFR